MYLCAFRSTTQFLLDLLSFWLMALNINGLSKITRRIVSGKKRTHFYPLDNSPKTNIQGTKIEIERERKNDTRLEYNDFFPALFFLFETRFLIPFSLDENI